MSLGANPIRFSNSALNGTAATLDALRAGWVALVPPRSRPSRPIPLWALVAACDVVVVLAVFLILMLSVSADRMPDGLDGFLSLRVTIRNVLVLGCFAGGIAVVLRWAGLYDASRVRRWPDEVRRILVATVPITAMAAVVPLAGHSHSPVDATSLVLFLTGTGVALVAGRGVRAGLTRGQQLRRRRVVIVGTGPRALRIYRALCSDFLTAYSVLGFVDSRDAIARARGSFIARRALGGLEDLERVLGEHVDEVHIGLPVKSHYEEIQDTIRVCERLGVKAIYQADLVDTVVAKARMQAVPASAPQVQLQMAPEGVRVAVKRVVDIIGALIILIPAIPILLAAAATITLTSGAPVLYTQERYGLNRRRFRMFKLRTMVRDAERLQDALESRNEASGPVFKIADDPRLTPVGRFLRRSSIDELPQLFNVLRGDMSLVGPRPLPLRDVNRFTRTGDLRRFSVRPGMTCLWQTSGRSGIGFDDWIALDLQYIDRWSLVLDMLILVRTIPAVVWGKGAE